MADEPKVYLVHCSECGRIVGASVSEGDHLDAVADWLAWRMVAQR